MKTSYFKNFLHLGIGNIIFILVSTLVTPIITRMVSPEEYGTWALFTMYGSLFSSCVMMGLDQAFVRYYYEDVSINYKRKLLSVCITPAIFISIVFLLLSQYSYVFNIDKKMVVFLSFYMLLLIIQSFSSLIIRMEYRTLLLAGIQNIQKIIFLVLLIFGIKNLNISKIWILILATIVSTLIIDIIAILPEQGIWRWRFKDKGVSNKNLKGIYRYGFPLMLSIALISLFQAMGKIFLSRFSNANEVGIYSSALSIVNIFSVIQATFTTLWTPIAIEYHKNNPDSKDFYVKINQVMLVILFLFGYLLILFKDVLILFLGEEYRSASYILPFLIFTPIMYTISETTYYGIVFLKKSVYNIWIGIIALLANIVGNFLWVPLWGARGAAIASGFAYIAFFYARTMLSNKLFYINYQLKKFSFTCLMLIIFALVSSFNTPFILRLGIFAINLLFLILMYKETFILIYTNVKIKLNQKGLV